MLFQGSLYCPDCESPSLTLFNRYPTQSNGTRCLYQCNCCGLRFSETAGTPMENLKTPISKVASVIVLRSEGLGIRATARSLKVKPREVTKWEARFAGQKAALKLYAQVHKFLQLTFEADEVYTRVGKNLPPAESEGWTMVVMERASRYLAELECGIKDQELFEQVLTDVLKFATKDMSFFSDGERRYGLTLFQLCQQRIGRRKVLPAWLQVRLKNKGSQDAKNSRLKYEKPVPHAPGPDHIEEKEIHANHVEAYNASLRRRCSAMRRRTNTYAKHKQGLQRALDLQWVMHNFVRPHFTTGEIPAVALGLHDQGFSVSELLMMRPLAS